ncbi:MAG: glutathione S-transferase family protein [Alphaproteobacteria bacterium]|nr:glutathione S-transferase family protein [Alphaproteobacteria bacterium]
MIELFTAATPNGQKVHIMLEECGLPYNEHWVDIDAGDQFKPEYLEISPNNKIPALVDSDGPDGRPISLFESGAILVYLAEKTGLFLPAEPEAHWQTLTWLFWQMGGFGPFLGQAHHFNAYAPTRIKYAMDRYTNEAKRLYGVLDRQLAGRDYIAGEYSIADIATFPWTRLYQRQGVDLEAFPNVKRWQQAIAARPAVAKDMKRTEDIVNGFTEKSWSVLFGAEQYQKR